MPRRGYLVLFRFVLFKYIIKKAPPFVLHIVSQIVLGFVLGFVSVYATQMPEAQAPFIHCGYVYGESLLPARLIRDAHIKCHIAILDAGNPFVTIQS